MRHFTFGLAVLAFTAAPMGAQSSPFTQLDAAISYRLSLPWRVIASHSTNRSHSVILQYHLDGDTGLTVAIAAFDGSEDGITPDTDSLLLAGPLSAHAQRLTDTLLSSEERLVLWRDTTSLAMDRFAHAGNSLVWLRILMPANPPPSTVIRRHLHAIDDLVTTIRARGRLLFPKGSSLGLVVY